MAQQHSQIKTPSSHRKKRHISDDQSQETATVFNPKSLTNPDSVMAMQRTLGNATTKRLLQRAPIENGPVPTVGVNQDVKQGRGFLDEQPEMRDILDGLVRLARQTISDFRNFRDGGYQDAEGISIISEPTKALDKAMSSANKQLTHLVNDAEAGGLNARDSDNWIAAGAAGLLEKAHSGVSRLKFISYLQSHFDSEELTVLQQAFAFSSTAEGSLFGLEPLHIKHDYEVTLRQATNWITTPHEAIIKYNNNIGMRYEKKISFRWLGAGANVLQEFRKNAVKELGDQFKSVIDEKIETTFGADPSFDDKTVTKDDANQFWLPNWFETGSVSQFAAFAKADYKHVLAKGLPSAYAGVHVLTFDHKAMRLSFDMSEDLFSFDPSLPDMRLETLRDVKEKVMEIVEGQPEFDPDADIDEENAGDLKEGRYNVPKLVTGEVEGDWDVLYKHSVNINGTKAKVASDDVKIDYDLRDPVDPTNPSWQPLVTAEIFFETGEATISGESEEAIRTALKQVRGYLKKDPGAALRFMVLGKASKAWAKLGDSDTAAAKNYELSQVRAQSTMSQLKQLRIDVLGDLLPQVLEEGLEGDWEGAQMTNQQYEDVEDALGSDQEARWMNDVEYKKAKSQKRSKKDKDNNDAVERGASIRIAVRPGPREAPDADAELKKHLNNPTPETIAGVAVAKAQAVLTRMFGPAK